VLAIGCGPDATPRPAAPVVVVDRGCLGELKRPATPSIPVVPCADPAAVLCLAHAGLVDLSLYLDRITEYIETAEARCRPHKETSP
jgi:hypothetical protein